MIPRRRQRLHSTWAQRSSCFRKYSYETLRRRVPLLRVIYLCGSFWMHKSHSLAAWLSLVAFRLKIILFTRPPSLLIVNRALLTVATPLLLEALSLIEECRLYPSSCSCSSPSVAKIRSCTSSGAIISSERAFSEKTTVSGSSLSSFYI